MAKSKKDQDKAVPPLIPQTRKASAKDGKGGRPKIEWDLDVIKALGFNRNTHEDMANILGVSVSKIDKEMSKKNGDFCNAYKTGLSSQKHNLTRHAFKLAYSKNSVPMTIFLLKNFCGMSDRVEHINDEPLTIVHVDEHGKPAKGLPIHLQDLRERTKEPKQLDPERPEDVEDGNN